MRLGTWRRSKELRAHGHKLLQVMDAFRVNQTDGEGGQVEDEALVQLEETERGELDHESFHANARSRTRI